jgi:hypothetical protein
MVAQPLFHERATRNHRKAARDCVVNRERDQFAANAVVAKMFGHFGMNEVDRVRASFVGQDRDVAVESYFVTMGVDVVDDVETRHCK